MLRAAFAEVGSRTDAGQSHFLHVALHGFPIDDEPWPQRCGDAPRAIEGMGRVDLVNPMLDRDFFRRWPDRSVIQTGPTETQQLGLRLQREGRRLPFEQRQALSVTQGRDQIFFGARRLGSSSVQSLHTVHPVPFGGRT